MNVNIPVDDLMNEPVPLITPDNTSSNVLVLIVPPPAPRAILRLVDTAALVNKVPPLNVTLPVPKLLIFAILVVPPAKAVPPVYVLVLDKTNVPAPDLVKVPVPLKMPDNVSSKPLVSIVPPPALKAISRLVDKIALVCKVPPPNAIFPVPKLLILDMANAPALILVKSEYVLFPDKVSVPVPVLVNAPVPLIIPLKVSLKVLVLNVPPMPFKAKLLATDKAALACTLVLFNATVPVPKAVLLPIPMVPALTVVPPE